MSLLLLSFFGGVLTILSPCVLPLLPVIVGGSLAQANRMRPVIITLSLTTSLVLFTLLLKFSTALIDVPPRTWSIISGSLVIGLGIITLFPQLWEKFSVALRLSDRSNTVLLQSAKKQTWFGPVLIGFSLGPVFSSCSPTYALILATVLPQSFFVGLLNLAAYAAGLATVLLLIAIFGQRLVQKLKWAADPEGWFKKILAVLFIVVGIAIVSGVDKKIETYFVEKGFGVTAFESNAVENISLDMGDAQTTEQIEMGTKESDTKMNVRSPKPAPELIGLQEWMNSNPLTLEELKGKVVLIDFWTYSCINCIRTLPVLNSWHETYADDGFVIIGVHAPEFAFEKEPVNVKAAIEKYAIKYPVALDNNFETWRAYNNRYWPAKYFIDKTGELRHTHFGEGEYEESERIIQALLAENEESAAFNTVSKAAMENDQKIVADRKQTPETYLGSARFDDFLNKDEVKNGATVNYTAQALSQNEWTLGGEWRVNGESAIAESTNAVLQLKFASKKVYIVAGGETDVNAPKKMKVLLNGQQISATDAGVDVVDGIVTIDSDRLYEIANFSTFRSGDVVELQPEAGVVLHAFTFGNE
jgi:cytochrome c biogenesis protein CcdA/thiol-disulfide isomerase/thioredoxin